MPLIPHNKEAIRRKIITWDLEWCPHDDAERAGKAGLLPGELRLAGVFDGSGYRFYTTVAEFLDCELIRENNGAWFYAHYSGMSDMQYVFQYLLENEHNLTVDACMIGSSAALVTIKRGRYRFHFVDSFHLLRIPLNDIASWFGLSKSNQELEDPKDMFYRPIGELASYNEQDCRILYKALTFFEDMVIDLGGQLQKTIASTALQLFRMAYLDAEIATSGPVNELARGAYVASRVEVFKKIVPEAEYYDINSCFPYAMTFSQPGPYECTVYGIPDKGHILADVTVDVPDCYIPPLPYRKGKGERIFHPVGTWRTWLTRPDIELLYEGGGRIETTHEVLLFGETNAFADYARDIYDRRKNSDDEGERAVLKFLLNSLYGKLAESSIKSRIILNPEPSFFELPMSENGKPGRRLLAPGIWELIEDVYIPHAHVPIAANITAISRGLLTRYLWKAPEVYYCDTDSIVTTPGTVLPTGKNLGELKHEGTMYDAVFHRPKLYAYWTDCGKCRGAGCKHCEQGRKPVVKAKGFGKLADTDARMNIESFDRVINGNDVSVNQFLRLKSLIRSGQYTPREIQFEKGLRTSAIEKRVFSEDGQSRPWNVDELRKVK
jgi:hypothetical protein